MRKIVNINESWGVLKDAKEIPVHFPTEWEEINHPHT